MTQNVLLVDGELAAVGGTPETVYTSPAGGKGTRITAVTCTNISVATDTYSIYTRSDGAAPGPADSLILDKSLATKESDTPPEVINHFIRPGGTLSFETATALSITLKVSGVEFT